MDAWYCPIDEEDVAVLEGRWVSEYGDHFLFIRMDLVSSLRNTTGKEK